VKTSKQKSDLKRYLLISAMITIGLFVVSFSFLFSVSYAYVDQFYPGAMIAGVKVGGQNFSDAEQKITQKFDSFDKQSTQLVISNQRFAPTLGELGVYLDWSNAIKETKPLMGSEDALQGIPRLIKYIFSEKKTSLPVIKIDNTKISANIDKILATTSREAIDAKIENQNGNFVISKEESGQGVNQEELNKILVNSVQKLNPLEPAILSISYQSKNLEPTIVESDLLPIKSKAEELIKVPFNFTYEDQRWTANGSDIAKWIKFTQKEKLYEVEIDRQAVEKYIVNLAKKIDKKPVQKKISVADNNQILQEGREGQELVRSKAVNEIIASLNTQVPADQTARTIAFQVNKKSFETIAVYPPFTPGLYPGKYIEVNLTDQKLYLWDGQNKVNEYRVSTGSPKTPTREGVFAIRNKAPVGIYAGWHMPWWMAVVRDSRNLYQGIHELPTYLPTGKKEGESYLGRAVSHGCIRLNVGDAKTVYDWTPVGTPVFIHK
jgi:lipoprotein-anchoring transpeptidase ErfK/SrfK